MRKNLRSAQCVTFYARRHGYSVFLSGESESELLGVSWRKRLSTSSDCPVSLAASEQWDRSLAVMRNETAVHVGPKSGV